MRTTLLLASVSALVSNLSTADACGSYVPTPRVLQLAQPYAPGEPTFVLTGEAPTGKVAWQRIAPMSYDSTEVADAPDLAQPMEITLVGPAGNKLVSSKRRSFIQHSFERHSASAALEITAKRGDFAIALAGRHTGAVWLAAEGEHDGTRADRAWAIAAGAKPLSNTHVYVSRIHGSNLELVSVIDNDGVLTLVRSGTTAASSLRGYAMGIVAEHGAQFIVTQDRNDGVRAEELWI